MAGAGLDPGAAGRGLVLGAHGGVLHTAAVGDERQAVLGEVRNPPGRPPAAARRAWPASCPAEYRTPR